MRQVLSSEDVGCSVCTHENIKKLPPSLLSVGCDGRRKREAPLREESVLAASVLAETLTGGESDLGSCLQEKSNTQCPRGRLGARLTDHML